LVGGFLVCAAAAIAACGIDESGLELDDASTFDVTTPDGNPQPLPDAQSDVQTFDVVTDAPLPPTCATTDVSCFGLDGGVPDGWSPYFYVADGGACPSSAFAAQPLVTNTRLTGGCVCSCTAQGSWSCPPTLAVSGASGNNNCNAGSVTIEAGVCQNVAAFNLDKIEQVGAATAAGTGIACDGGAASAPVAAWDAVTLCAAGCDAGAEAICGAPSNARCIATEGVTTCPGNLVPIIVGGSASPSCNGCSCTDETAPTCTAVAHLYWSTGLGDGTCSQGVKQDLTLNNTCQPATQNYDGYIATWNDPGVVTCGSAGGGGDAGLSTPKTVCCTP
jgi:hypothetical protein